VADTLEKYGDDPFMKTARARFHLADEGETKQRERERNDLAFYAGEQWPADIKLLRQGQQPTNGMPAVPARPTLVINSLREPVRQVLNEERQSDLGVEIIAADDFGDLGVTPDVTEIKLREGLVRRIQRQSSAADARTWAYTRAVIAGRGYYQVMTKFLPGKTMDQEVCLERIYNQSAVLGDPSRMSNPGGARWWFVGVDMLWDRYAEEHPKNAAGDDNPLVKNNVGENDDAWMALHDEYPDWFYAANDKAGDDEAVKATRSVRVTNYWYVESESRELAILEDGSYAWKEELNGRTPVDTRTVVQQKVKWAKIDGVQKLEESDWAGPDLPIIEVLGEELQPFDHERRVEGMIYPSRDAQMGSNYMISKLVETVGLTPIPPLQVDPDAISEYEEWYKVANTRALPYLPSRTYDDQGRQLQQPHRPAVDPNLMPISQSIALFQQFTEKTTAVPAAALGDIDPVTRSGKAISALTQNSRNSTSNYLDNLVRSIRREGEILNNLLYPIYGARPGRIVRILTGAGQPQTMLINHPEGQPTPTPPAGMQIHGQAKLTQDANFNVAIKVTRNYDTRRQEIETTLGEIISKDPQYGLQTFGDLFFKYQDGPGSAELSERAKMMLAPPIQQMLQAQANGGTFDPRDAQIKQLQGQIGQLQQVIQGKQAEKQAEMAGKFQIASMQESADSDRHRQDNETKLAVAALGAKWEQMQNAMQLLQQEIARVGTQQHDAGQAALDRSHEVAMAHADAGQEQDMQQQDQQAQQAQNTHDASMAVMQAQPPQPQEPPPS
jgi:Phage P22-like portal protein